MKKLSLIAAALALASSAAFAGSTNSNFDVSVTFTSSCTVATAATPMAFTYTAFGAVQNASTSTTFNCTRNLVTPTFSFDNTVGTGSAAASSGTITGEGVIAGLRYTLSAAVPTKGNGTAASAGAGGTGGSNGTADTYAVSISAQMPGNQAGDATAPATTQTRVLTIAY